jgi:adenylate kinase
MRGYSEKKATNNISSEIIGVCLYDAIKKFGKNKVAEIDSTGKKPDNIANRVISIVKRKSKRSTGKIDWLALIVKNDDLQRFFMYG